MFFERPSMTSDGGSFYISKKVSQFAPRYTIDSIPGTYAGNHTKYPVFAAWTDELKERLINM